MIPVQFGESYDRHEAVMKKIKSVSDEYTKIQAKESKLSANERRLIVERYNKMERIIKNG